jgi:hypothetical protein
MPCINICHAISSLFTPRPKSTAQADRVHAFRKGRFTASWDLPRRCVPLHELETNAQMGAARARIVSLEKFFDSWFRPSPAIYQLPG